MLAARLGCQLCALACSMRGAAAGPLGAYGALAGASLPGGALLLLSDALAASLQLLHLPVCFQASDRSAMQPGSAGLP